MRLELLSSVVRQGACPLCGGAMEQLALVEDAPAVLGCAIAGRADHFLSFGIASCVSCGFIATDADPEDMAYEQMHSEALGPTWERHHNEFAAFCGSHLKLGAKILEVGPSSSPMVRRLPIPAGEVTYVDLIDPLPFALKGNETSRAGLFPVPGLANDYDAVIASHVFEHAPDMPGFLAAAMAAMGPDGQVFISIPDFETWLDKRYWNAVTPEHSSYPFRAHLAELARRQGLAVEMADHRGHSVFARFHRAGAAVQTKAGAAEAARSRALVRGWAEMMLSSIGQAERELAALDFDSAEVGIAAASHLSQYPVLMSEALRKKVRFVLDNSAAKHGQRLYGTELVVHPFADLAGLKQPVTIVFNSPYRDELCTQIAGLNPRARIIAPA